MSHVTQSVHVLFVCVENACRSQMAEAFAKHYGRGRIVVYSAGSRPRGQIDPQTVAMMRERGLDLSGQTSKGLADLPTVTWDAIVTMGCGDACPQVPAKRRIDWQVPNPSGQPPEGFRHIRDAVDAAVKRLVDELTAPS